ncbi:MAG: hypothetical protein Q8N53_08245, partial [Longimicrobiales bacterium]|nr:hypothetical protein [Longimicrobiales bacterium]
MGLDQPDAAHVGGEGVHLIDALHRLEARIPVAQVQELELMGPGPLELGELEVHAPDPVAPLHQVAHQVVPDEAPRPG